MTVRRGSVVGRPLTGRPVVARAAAVSALAVGAVLVLAGCGTPPWEVAASASASASGAPSASASGAPSRTPSAKPSAVGGDLASGAASRTLQAGDLTVDVRYWSTLPMDEWTPGADKPLSMSVTTRSGGDAEVRLVRAAVAVSYRTGSGADVASDGSPAEQADGQGYAVAAPQSWSGTFVLGAAPAEAARLRAIVTLVFTETTAGSGGATAQQTATDTLSIDLAPAG
ncbi:hypothetical protein GCM10009706_11060 [Curtobacterium citreum]|uniref:Lipoprotein LpqN n=1 Tax=Curtobacterium citreum TaxID=2036 RepID=A0ABT2HEH3_9MICO|nr:hypothetical protein [Curtobacterium citreum]MCS6521659.1 hypothetical protein [Curtobacterium citreum]TQJ27047.1 hypothetical protein FB462_0894 [Curtobacterium citreum]GGL74399.1 hypothetical protein GCM10009706_11060 [Curtobacterium citreum]